MSDHFKKTMMIVALVAAMLAGGYLWLRQHIVSTITDSRRPLPTADVEQVRVDPSTHKLTIITATGTRTVTLPDRTSTVDILKNGQVKVTSQQFGLEHHIFASVIGSDSFRIGAGMDALYWKRLDLGVGVAGQVGLHAPVAFAKLTYNVAGNVQAGVVYQTNQYVGGIVSVRLF